MASASRSARRLSMLIMTWRPGTRDGPQSRNVRARHETQLLTPLLDSFFIDPALALPCGNNLGQSFVPAHCRLSVQHLFDARPQTLGCLAVLYSLVDEIADGLLQ